MRRFILFIFGLLFLSNYVCWFAVRSLLERLAAPDSCRWLLAGFIVLQVVALVVMIGARALGHQPGTGMGRPLLAFAMIWNLLLALPTAVLNLVWLFIWWLAAGSGSDSDTASSGRVIGLIIIAVPFGAAFFAAAVATWQLQRFRVQWMTLTIPNLPPQLKGFTIAHLSDLHIGRLTHGQVLEDMVKATNQMKPDLILLTGDLINFALEDLPHGFEILRKMKARYGLYSCEGNHDLIENSHTFETAAGASGLAFLFDDAASFSVNGQIVQVLGLRWGEGMTPQAETVNASGDDALGRLLAQTPPGAFTILLAHHPQVFDAAAKAGVPLTLAGHTHGGQLMLTPGIGFGPWLYRYWSGLYRQGASQLVVSNGTGNWFPLRLGAPAEIIHITLE